MAGPLTGVRVADFTRMFAGPCGAETLGDLGAEVIKIEEPRIGDPTRRNLPFWGGESAYYMSLNRGKRSITLDLKTEAGREAALALIASCEVVVENYRPGVMTRLGLDFDSLSARQPRLVMCSLSGFGATGPLRDKISFDLVNQAMAGMIDLTGEPGQRPVRIGVPVGDMAGGLYLAIAVLAGLTSAAQTGIGCWIDLSLHDVLVSLLGEIGQRYLSSGEIPTRTGGRDRDRAPQGCFLAADGYLVVSALEQAQWIALTGVLGQPGLAADPRFATGPARKTHEAVLEAVLRAHFRERRVEDWTSALLEAGVPSAPVLPLGTSLESPLVARRGIVFEAEHPTAGTVRNLASPLVIDGRRGGMGGVAPLLGADTESVLRELGYSDQAVAALAEQGVTRTVARG